MKIDQSNEIASNLLDGKKIVVSGKFLLISREELKRLIEVNGGQNVSSVSSVTSILVAGENIGPSKLKKAQKLNIEIINEQTFLK